MASYTQNFSVVMTSPVATTVQCPLGIHLGTWLGDTSDSSEGSVSQHWSDVKTGFGRVPSVAAATMINSYQDGYATPNQWGGDAGSWSGIFPTDGSVSPLLHGRFTNGTTTDSDYAGVVAGTYDSALTAALNSWKSVASFKTMYFRINWEFNTNFLGWGVPSSGQVANWVAAWKHWCNVCHTWGNSNGIQVRMVWSPDTSIQSAESTTFSLPVVNFFPIPDGSAVNGRYVDVIGCDYYMAGWGVKSNFGQTSGALASSTDWSFGTFVQMCQAYNCNFGISETGDGPSFDNNNGASDGTMANLANYLNTLATLSPAVPIEYIAIFDCNAGGASQCTAGNQPSMLAGWRSCLGTGGNGSIPNIMTIAPV
jgi:hypothetical protein